MTNPGETPLTGMALARHLAEQQKARFDQVVQDSAAHANQVASDNAAKISELLQTTREEVAQITLDGVAAAAEIVARHQNPPAA